MSLETGQPAFAFAAIDWNAPDRCGYLRGDGEMERGDGKAIAVLVDDSFDLLSICSGTKFAMPSSLTNDMVKQAA